MYPELLRFLGIHFVRSYGVLLAIAFLLGIIWARKRAMKAGIPGQHVIDLSFIVLIASIVGSRFFYVIYHLDEFSDNILNVINPFQGDTVGIYGLSMMGGVVLAVISAFLFFYFKKIYPWPLLDAMMPMFALGLGIARVGCFLNGCCFGLPHEGLFGVVFPSDSGAGFHFPETPLIPTQIYSSLAGLAILGIVLWSERFKRFEGHSFWLTIALYSTWRFIIDFYRYYEDSMILTTMDSTRFTRNQLLSVLMFIISVTGYIIMYRKSRSGTGDYDKRGVS
jgi:phosphatidylglycerol:prolipoprotein diacylglycerol transferase